MNLFQHQSTEFQRRHIGPNEVDTAQMLATIGVSGIEELVNKTIPSAIHLQKDLNIPPAISEFEYLNELKQVAAKNKLFKTYIGQG